MEFTAVSRPVILVGMSDVSEPLFTTPAEPVGSVVLPLGPMGDLFSSGSVFALNVAVGAEVTSGVVVLLARFLAQALSVREVK